MSIKLSCLEHVTIFLVQNKNVKKIYAVNESSILVFGDFGFLPAASSAVLESLPEVKLSYTRMKNTLSALFFPIKTSL